MSRTPDIHLLTSWYMGNIFKLFFTLNSVIKQKTMYIIIVIINIMWTFPFKFDEIPDNYQRTQIS